MHEYNQMQCPKCQTTFPQGLDVIAFMSHIKECQRKQPKEAGQQTIYEKVRQMIIKVPIDSSMTKFRWEKKTKIPIAANINNLQPNKARKLSFQEKQSWLRKKLESLRISWTMGADYIRIDKNNILMGSLVEIKNVDMHKEVKIEFLGEKVNDAGGLLREWIHMVIKEIFDYNTGLFIFAETEDIMYKLKWDEEMDEYFSEQLLTLFGTILGKSIFERIPLTCYLDRTILRQLSGGAVKIEDIFGYDTELYKSWKFMLEAQNVEDLDICFVTYKNSGGTMKEIQLLEGHKDIKVNNDNKLLYVDLCLQMHTTNKVARSLNYMRQGVSKVFPLEWLSIFEPYELQMLIYGVPFIDLQDWHDNTEYKEPYSKNHKVIKWFWEVMEQFDQEQLSRVLHFCTGSTRTPIHGFKKLESNRGNYSKFLIVSIPFDKKNPYPRGHTCFNRLELPQYSNLNNLKTYLTAISKNELDGIFGLD